MRKKAVTNGGCLSPFVDAKHWLSRRDRNRPATNLPDDRPRRVVRPYKSLTNPQICHSDISVIRNNPHPAKESIQMRIAKTLVTTTMISLLTLPAFAGGLSDQIMEAPVAAEEAMAPAGSSVDPTLIVLGILGLLLLGASISDSGDSGSESESEVCELTPEECLFEVIFDR